MPIEFGVKVVEVGNSLRVAIPKEILRAVGVQKVDILLMTTIDSQILLREGGGHTTERAQTKRLGATTQTDSPVSWAKKLRHTFSVNPGGPTTHGVDLTCYPKPLIFSEILNWGLECLVSAERGPIINLVHISNSTSLTNFPASCETLSA